jgi:hypothetical protein
LSLCMPFYYMMSQTCHARAAFSTVGPVKKGLL